MNLDTWSRIAVRTIVLLLLLFPLEGFAELTLGEMSLSRAGQARSLRHAPRLNMRAPGFRLRIGGVAFENVAKPRDASVARIETLSYSPDYPDGRRLGVTFQNSEGQQTTVRADLYDWQLAPILIFADSEDKAVFTLFGEFEDEARTEEIISEGGRILNYHPAFEDTLLGLRLFQADILLLTDDACDLPKQEGKYILGAGEKAPNVEANREAMARTEEWLGEQEYSFQSYVISDLEQTIVFSHADGILAFSGRPYWDCWMTNPDYETATAEVYREIELDLMRRVMVRLDIGPKLEIAGLSDEELERRFLELALRDENLVETTTESVAREIRLEIEAEDPNAWLTSRIEKIAPGIEQTITLTELSQGLGEQIYTEPRLNPAILDALERTMHFTAFFRYVASTNPNELAELKTQIGGLAVKPKIDTPDHFIDPNQAALIELLEALGE